MSWDRYSQDQLVSKIEERRERKRRNWLIMVIYVKCVRLYDLYLQF